MDSSIIRGSFPDEEDDLGLQHNRNIGNAGQSEDIIIVVEKAIKGMLERKRFSSSNVGSANYLESECADQEECDSNIFGENRDTGISVSALSRPVGVAHNIQFDTDHHYGFAAATAEEIRLDNEVFVNDSDSSVRKDFIDHDESFIIDSDVLGSEDVSTEEVLDDLENQGQFEQLSNCSLDDARKSNYGTNCFNNNSRNDNVEEFPIPGKHASVQNFIKDNKRFVKLVTNSSKNSDVNSVEVTPSIVYKNNFSQNKNLRKSDSLKQFYESVASNLSDDKNDSLCVVQETSYLTPESNGLDEKKMPVLINENDVIISPCEEERPPPELIPQTVETTSELNPLNMIPPPEFTTKVNEQVIGVVHPFNHENNLNIDNQVSNISGVPILTSNGKPLNPPTEVITRNRLRSHCLDSVINTPRRMIKKQESFSTVILKQDSLKTMAVSTMLNASIDKSDYIPKEVKMRQGISSGNHYRSAHKGINHVNSEGKKEFQHVNDNRLTLTVPIHLIDKVPEILETSSVADKSFDPKKEFISKGQPIISENIRNTVHDNLEIMKNNKSNASYSSVCNVMTDKIIVNENKKNSLQDKSTINMSALPSMPILLSPTMEETQTPSTKTNKDENSRKIDHTNSGRKQAPARSVATPLRSFQRLPIAELSLSTPNLVKSTVTKHKKKSKHDELLLSVSVTNDKTISPVKQVRNHIKATRLEEYRCKTEIYSNPLISHLSLNKIEMTKSVMKDGLHKKIVNNALVKNFQSTDLISSSLEPLTIETKETDSSFKTFDNLLTDLDLDKTQTNPLDESVHSLDPFIKDIQPAADILEVLPGADILDGGITDKEIIISSADVGLLKSDILEEEGQVLTLEDSTLSILNFFDKDLSSSKALESHENESFENPEKFSNKNDLSFTIPEIKFEEDKVVLDRPESTSNTNDEKSPVVENNKLNNNTEEIGSKTKSTDIDDLILIPGTNNDTINSKLLDNDYPITSEQKIYDDSKCNLLSEIEKINEILDRELANTIGNEVVSDKCPQNPSSSSSNNVDENKDSNKTRAAEIVKETNLRVDTLHEKSKVSENCASDKNSEVPVGTCDDQPSSKEVALSNSEESSVVKNQTDRNSSLEEKNIQGTHGNNIDASMSDEKDKSYCDIRSDMSHCDLNSKLSKGSSSFNIISSAYKNNNTYRRKEPEIYIRSSSRKRKRKRKKASEKHQNANSLRLLQKDNNLETTKKCDSKFGATISFGNKMTTSSDKFNLIPNGKVSPYKLDFIDVPCRRHKKFSINIEDYLCKPSLQNKVNSNINDKDISLPLLEKSESRNNLPDISQPNTVGKKGNENSLIVNDLILTGENEFSPRVSKEYANVNRKQSVKSPQNNDLREKKAGLEAIIKKLKSEKNASDEYTEKWLIGENTIGLNVLKLNENVFEPENSDSLQSCSSKIETEIIHDNLDAQLEIELNSVKDISIICKSELEDRNVCASVNEKSCSDLATTTHENLPDSSEKDTDSNLKHLKPTGAINLITDDVNENQNEKIILPSEINSSSLPTISSENSVRNSTPVTTQENHIPSSSLILISKNSESISFENGVESPTCSNLTTDKILPSESEFIEKGIPLIETYENCNKPHVLNEIETGKLNKCVTINDNNKVNTISNLSENDKNTKHFLSKSSVINIPDMDQQNSLSRLATNTSQLFNDPSSDNVVSEIKVESSCKKASIGYKEKDQNSSDKLPVIPNPPGLVDELVRENKKESRNAAKDKNHEIESAPDTKLCALGKGNDSSSLILKKKSETENTLISPFDAAANNVNKENKDLCMFNNLSDEVEKTVGLHTSKSNLQTLDKIEQNKNITVVSFQNINQANDVSNSITKTTHKYDEPIANIDNKKSINERSKLELSKKTCIQINENTNPSQDIESCNQTVVDNEDSVDAVKMTDELINATEVVETNIKKECVINHKNVAEKNEENPSCIENLPIDYENATKKTLTEKLQSVESFSDEINVIDVSEKTNFERNENPVKPVSIIESVNPTVSDEENGIDITDKTNLIFNATEKTKTTDNTCVTSTFSIVNIENCINEMGEAVTENLQNKENVSDSKSCMDVTDTAENTFSVCNEITEKPLSTGSDYLSNSSEENIINVIDKTNQISASDITDKSCSGNVIPISGENCIDGNGEKVTEQLQNIESVNDETNVIHITKTVDEVTKITEKTYVDNGNTEEQQSIESVNQTNIDEENNINDNREALTEKLLTIDTISDKTTVIEVTEVTETTEKTTIIDKTNASEITKTTNNTLGFENVTPTVSEENGVEVTEKILSIESLNNETNVHEVAEANVNVIETTKIDKQINIENSNPSVSEDGNNVNEVINITNTTEKGLPVNDENSENSLIIENVNIPIADKDPNITEKTFTQTDNKNQNGGSDGENRRNTIENIIIKNIVESQSVGNVCRIDTDDKHNTNPSVKTSIDNSDQGFGNFNQTVCDNVDSINTTANVEKSLSKENPNDIVSGHENDINLTVKTFSENKPPCIESVNQTIVDETEGMDVSLPSEISTKSTEKCNIEEENSIEVNNSQVSSSESVNVRCDIQSSLEVDSITKTHLDCSSNPASSIPLIESTESSDNKKQSDEKVEKPAIDSLVGNLSTTSIAVCNEADSVFELNNFKSADKNNKNPIDSSSKVLSRSESNDSINKIDSDKILNEPSTVINDSLSTEISYNNNNNTKEVDSDGVTNVDTNEAEADVVCEDSVDLKSVGMSVERNFPNQEKFEKGVQENHIEPNSLMADSNELVPENLLNICTSSPQRASEASIPEKPLKKRDKSFVSKTKCKIAVKNGKNQKLNSKAVQPLQGSVSVEVQFPPTNNNDSSQNDGRVKSVDSCDFTVYDKINVTDSSKQIDPKDNNDPDTFIKQFTKYIDSNNRFQTDKVTSNEGDTSLLTNKENPAPSCNRQSFSVILNDDFPKSTDKESEIEAAAPVNLKSEVNNLSIDNTKPFIGTADSNLSNNTDLKGIQFPESSKNEVAKLPVDECNEYEAIKNNSHFAPDTTIDNQVTSQTGTVDNLMVQPLSTSNEPADSHPGKVSKNDLLLGNVTNKMAPDTITEEAPEHSYYSAPDSSGEQSINKKEHTRGTVTDSLREQENIITRKREDSCLKEQNNMVSVNSEKQLKLEETRETSVIESGPAETCPEHAVTEVLTALSKSKLNSLSSEIFLSSHRSDPENSKHSLLSINSSQLKLPNSVEESCKSIQSMTEEIHESQVTNSVTLPLMSNLTFSNSTESYPEIVENSNSHKESEQIEKKNLNQDDDSNVKQEESASNVIVANYFQSILDKPTDSIILQHEKSDIDKKDVSKYGHNDRTDLSVNKINLRPRVVSKKDTVCKIKENDVSLSIVQNKEKGNKLKSDRQDETKIKIGKNITGTSVNIETSNNLRKLGHPNSVTSDEGSTDKIIESVLSTAIEELPKTCAIKEVRVVLEKIVHPDNPNHLKFTANIEITDHKRKRQVLGHGEGVKRHSNTPNDQEEPPSKVLLLNSSKSIGDAPPANEHKKAKGKINSRSKNAVLNNEKNEVHTGGNICLSASVILSRLNSLSNIRECMYKNKVKRVFLPSNVYSCLKKDTQQQSKYSDLEIIRIDSTERNSRFKRRRRKSPLSVIDDESDEEDYSSRRRSGRTRLLNKRKKEEKALSSVQSIRNANGLSLRSNAKNDKLTKVKSLPEPSSVHERTVSSSMSAALSTTKRPHESEIGNEALPKKPNLSNEVSCSNNKPKTDNYLTNKNPIFAQEPASTFSAGKELEIPTLPPSCSAGPFGGLKVGKTVKEVIHNVVRIRFNQVATRDPQEEEDSDDDFMGFEDELPCGCLSESNATSQNCVGYCFIRKKLSYLKRTMIIELSSKHSPSPRRKERFCTFRPLRRQESGEEQDQLRSDKSVELHHKTSANAKPFWDPGICYMSLGVEVRSNKNKEKEDCFSSKNVEVTNNMRTRQLVGGSDRKPSSVTNTDMNYEEDSDSSS